MCGMTDRPVQRPEGALIGRAQKRSGLSQRAAARLAGISENHWRNIVKGYSTVSAGVTAPIKGNADTVARMAQAVGVTPEELEEVGREDAAAVLRGLPPLEEFKPAKTVEELAAEVAALRREYAQVRRELDEVLSRERGRRREAG
jgi:transcriptional regulator with XRE-family HTH domain